MTLSPSRRRWLAVVGWLAVCALHGLMVAAGARWHSDIPDEACYMSLAKNLATEGRYAVDFPSFWHTAGQPNTYYAPGWPALLAVGYAALGEPGFWIVLWLVWCADSVLAYALAAACGMPVRGRWMAVGWLTANPLLAYYHGHLMTEPVSIGLLFAIALVGLALIRRPTAAWACAFAGLAAFAHLTRTTILIPVIAVWLMAALVVPWRRLLPLAALAGVVHLAIIAPWLLRMKEAGASPIATELKFGINLFTYCGAVGGDGYRPELRPVPYPEGLDELTPAERDKRLSQAALKGIAEHPEDYLRTCGDRAFYFFAPYPSFTPSTPLKTAGVVAGSVCFFYIPLLAGIAGLVARRPWGDARRLFVLAIFGWYVFHIAFHASIRQRLPSDALVAMLALTAWVRPPRLALPEPPPE